MSAMKDQITTVVDLTQLKGDKLPDKGKVARGDTHANPLNMLDFIWRCQMLKQKPGGRTLDEVYHDLQRLYYASEKAEDHQKPEFVERFKVLLDELDWETNAEQILLWIGDTLSDRGKNDALCIAVYYKLLEIKAKYSILLSNHDIEFLCRHYGHHVSLVPEQSCSVENLGKTPGVYGQYVGGLDGESWSSDFEEAYIKRLKLLDYELVSEGDDEKIILFSHAPVGIEAVDALLDYFCLTDKHAELNSAQAIANAIDAINNEFHERDLKEVLADFKATQLCSEAPDISPLRYICWNRSSQYLKDSKFVAKYVHGHCSHDEFRPLWFKSKRVNLNSYIGSRSAGDGGEIVETKIGVLKCFVSGASLSAEEEEQEEKKDEDESDGSSLFTSSSGDKTVSESDVIAEKQFVSKLVNGSAEALEEALTEYGDINKRIAGATLLHFASIGGNLVVLQKLLDVGVVNVNARNNMQQTPLMCVVALKNRAKVNVLLARSEINLLLEDEKGFNVLHYALLAEEYAVAHKLCVKDNRVLRALSKRNLTVLGEAVSVANEDMINWILEFDPHLQQAEASQPLSALKVALGLGNITLALKLIKHGLTSLGTTSKESLLRYAVRFHHTEIVKYLIEKLDQDPTSSEAGELPVIAVAAKYGYTDIFEFLVNQYHKKQKPVPFTVFTEPALQFHTRQNEAFIERCLSVVLAPAPADLANFLKKFIEKPFYHAKTMKTLCKSGHIDLTSYLPNGLTVLRTAILHDDADLCEMLVSQGFVITLDDILFAVEQGASLAFEFIFEKFDVEDTEKETELIRICEAILDHPKGNILAVLADYPDDLDVMTRLLLLAVEAEDIECATEIFKCVIEFPRVKADKNTIFNSIKSCLIPFSIKYDFIQGLKFFEEDFLADCDFKEHILSAIRYGAEDLTVWLLEHWLKVWGRLDASLCHELCEAAVNAHQFELLGMLIEKFDQCGFVSFPTAGAAAGAGSAVDEASDQDRTCFSCDELTKAAYIAIGCQDMDGFDALLKHDINFTLKFNRAVNHGYGMVKETILDYAISENYIWYAAKLLEKDKSQVLKLSSSILGKLLCIAPQVSRINRDVKMWQLVVSQAEEFLIYNTSCFSSLQLKGIGVIKRWLCRVIPKSKKRTATVLAVSCEFLDEMTGISLG